MRADYKEVQRQADRLQHRFGGIADDPNHPSMRALQQQMREVMEVIESDKPARAIEDRIKSVINLIRQIGDQDNQAMSPSDNDSLRGDYEGLRDRVRQLPNY